MKSKIETVNNVMGNVFRKVAESALHAAVFAYVSKKVSNLMSKDDKKEKVRVEECKEDNSSKE